MARPVNADAQATQARILAAAYELFASFGLAGASIRDIAKEAGVSLAMVHHYFGSKQGLYEASIATLMGELGTLRDEILRDLASGGYQPRELVDRAVMIGYRYARSHRNGVRLLYRSLVDTGEIDITVRRKSVLPFLDSVATAMSGLLGREPRELRLALQSIVFLIARWSLATTTEAEDLAGGAGEASAREDATAAEVAIERHLVDATVRLLGVP
jgi:AcrR family transcriptional regulator